MKQTLQELFQFTRSERRGIFYLIILILLFLFLPKLVGYFIHEKEYDYSVFEADITEWESGLLVKDSIRKSKYKNNNWSNKKSDYKKKEVVITPFPFNPNEASKEQLMDLGLPERTVKTLLNFRSKGGKFYKNEDLKKVYGLKEEWYDQLESYIRIKKEEFKKADKSNSYTESKGKYKPEKEDKEPIAETIPESYDNTTKVIEPAETKKSKPKKPKYKPIIVDINTSSVDEFQKVYGIGPSYAKRIVKYREQLGGFHSVTQISEIYGMPDSTYQKIKPGLKMGELSIKKININTASTDDLKAHPYLKWKIANAIVKYRESHGNYSSVSDLKRNYAVSEELYDKLSPYLTVE